MSYKPIYTITDDILNQIADISKMLGELTANQSFQLDLNLRRKNRIRTVQGSLAIEANTLTIEQVTEVLNGKIVIAPPTDIQEVKNAFEIYEQLDLLDPYSLEDFLKAHSVMANGVAQSAGEFRNTNVGVADSRTGKIIHFGALHTVVPQLMTDLFDWSRESRLHMLVKGCIVHYEIEVIHPFVDGNGRMGRLWHTVMLNQWDNIFSMLPIESIVYANQENYYKVLQICDNQADCTLFIEFMLDCIYDTIKEQIEKVRQSSLQVTPQVKLQVTPQVRRLLDVLGNDILSAAEIMERLALRDRNSFRKRYLEPALEQGLIEMTIPDKPRSRNQRYRMAAK